MSDRVESSKRTVKMAWSAVIVAWMGVALGSLLGWLDVSADTVTAGTQIIVVGLMVTVIIQHRRFDGECLR